MAGVCGDCYFASMRRRITSSPKLVTHLGAHDWIAMQRSASELGERRPHVVHDHATILLYLEGRVRFWMQGLYELAAGDLLLIPAGVAHYFVAASGVRSIGVSLRLAGKPSTSGDGLIPIFDAVRRGACASRRFTTAERDHLEQVFLQLQHELQRPSVGTELAVDAYVSLLTVSILRATEGASVARSSSSPVVARALEFVHRRACSGISLREVAEHVARSPAHVASLVKDQTGETVVGWITRARMSESRQLLARTDDTTEHVAERCGFASASHFYRAFKRAHGITPAEWRREHRHR